MLVSKDVVTRLHLETGELIDQYALSEAGTEKTATEGLGGLRNSPELCEEAAARFAPHRQAQALCPESVGRVSSEENPRKPIYFGESGIGFHDSLGGPDRGQGGLEIRATGCGVAAAAKAVEGGMPRSGCAFGCDGDGVPGSVLRRVCDGILRDPREIGGEAGFDGEGEDFGDVVGVSSARACSRAG